MLEEVKPSEWANERFGDASAVLANAVTVGIAAAHELALMAHQIAEMDSRDTYGHTLKVKQFEKLVEAARDIPGVTTRKPGGGRFDLVVICATSVALLPLRYSTERHERRQDVRLRRPVSEIKQSLLGLGASTPSRQQTIDQALEDLEDGESLDAQFEEMLAVEEQLAQFGRVVIVGFASNPTAGIWDLGWGDLELQNPRTGEVHWAHWEALPLRATASTSGIGAFGRLGAVPAAGVAEQIARFDEGAGRDDFDLVARTLGGEPPISESERAKAETGSEDDAQ